ncbi:uncharacterized protein BO80DRAFT_469583 [Aspergillus ibericus CBS 121593]|uniref:Uncharacterized protein n=1 Tax=Aspergillus ibericus CBS 121593 TaxID=1448316 RepID=A0A395GIG6_9EURO|nr:hypothetical protein BO80DRAFT_469583 [Aspergillus ibericus CBS 121593]RAK95229.1 hypothetical protein BO80DRAFT_469583 [Aspergillus ibericus CBS 121593]
MLNLLERFAQSLRGADIPSCSYGRYCVRRLVVERQGPGLVPSGRILPAQPMALPPRHPSFWMNLPSGTSGPSRGNRPAQGVGQDLSEHQPRRRPPPTTIPTEASEAHVLAGYYSSGQQRNSQPASRGRGLRPGQWAAPRAIRSVSDPGSEAAPLVGFGFSLGFVHSTAAAFYDGCRVQPATSSPDRCAPEPPAQGDRFNFHGSRSVTTRVARRPGVPASPKACFGEIGRLAPWLDGSRSYDDTQDK